MLHWAWVVSYAVLVLLAVGFFARWVLRLPKSTRNMFFISGGLFILGALGLELVEGYLYKQYGLDHIYNRVMYSLEELLEMGVIILFIYALIHYLASIKAKIKFVFEGKDDKQTE